jgi:hypothetical protein
MVTIAQEAGYPEEKIVPIGCDKCDERDEKGHLPHANTKTQFQSLRNSPRYKEFRQHNFVGLVGLQGPRLARTAELWLPKHMKFTQFSPPSESPLSLEKKDVIIRKILEYSKYDNPPEKYRRKFDKVSRDTADISFYLTRGWYGGRTEPEGEEATFRKT